MIEQLVAVIGSTGQIGSELMRAEWPDQVAVVAVHRARLDLQDDVSISSAIAELTPTTVVNAAGYTAVDSAEAEPDAARRLNAEAVETLASACERTGTRLIQLSTDYVFDGTKGAPYSVDDRPSPINEYGRSKVAGERAALQVDGNIVIRTAWVYSTTGTNFVKTIRRLARERRELAVVADQYGNPTSAADVARAIVTVATARDAPGGILHAAAPDPASWWDVARAVVDRTSGAECVEVRRITTEEYPTAARRPADSRLDSTLLERRFGHRLRPWREALGEVCRQLDDPPR